MPSENEETEVSASPNDELPVKPWFADREQTVLLLFRVNRRPISPPSLFAQQPDDVLDHLTEVLLFGEEVESGRRHKREWRLGNRAIDLQERTLSGRVGYLRSSVQYQDHFDEDAQEWIEDIQPAEVTAQAPFVFDATTRLLGVLQHPSFTAPQIEHVFTTLLNRGEASRGDAASTDWAVDPILNEEDFLRWVRTADAVLTVTFTAKLPNPDGAPELDPIWSRLQERKAKLIQERIEAMNPEEGLAGLDQDEVLKSYIAMATRAFGWIRGKRRKNGQTEIFNQRSNTRTHILRNLPGTFGGALIAIGEYLQGERPRDDEE